MRASRHQTLTVEVRRIGYKPWFGKLELLDTDTVLTVMLPRLAQELAGVTVTGEAVKSRLQLARFYDRWLMRQKGALSATFIGPEEIEKRHPSRASELLQGVLGVSLMHTERGGMVAKGTGGSCFMKVLLDGQPLCPPVGCNVMTTNGQSLSLERYVDRDRGFARRYAREAKWECRDRSIAFRLAPHDDTPHGARREDRDGSG